MREMDAPESTRQATGTLLQEPWRKRSSVAGGAEVGAGAAADGGEVDAILGTGCETGTGGDAGTDGWTAGTGYGAGEKTGRLDADVCSRSGGRSENGR